MHNKKNRIFGKRCLFWYIGVIVLSVGRFAPLTVEYPASASEIINLEIVRYYNLYIIQTEIFKKKN